jgi:hypothetical protein
MRSRSVEPRSWRIGVRALLLLLSLATASSTSAQATASQISLNGVKRITLRFALTEDDVQAGVDTTRLRRVVEARFKERGIELLPGRQGGDGMLVANVGATRTGTGTAISFFYSLEFRQPVRVVRLPDPPFPPVPGATWTSPVSFGSDNSATITGHLEEVTSQLLDGFFRDHAAGERGARARIKDP